MKNFSDVKIVVGYPPIPSKKGVPLLSQNRQFQYFNSPTYIYPMMPAYTATQLKVSGYNVHWMDGIAEGLSFDTWMERMEEINPDYFLFESKSPVIKLHWKLIGKIKKHLPNLKVIMVGDHATFMPLETFEHSSADYILTAGDYDFLAVNLLNHIHKGMPLDGGIYYRKGDKQIKHKKGHIRNKIGDGEIVYSTGTASLAHNLNDLPFVDRDLTKWELYAYKNGNYKYTPATYMYSGRDCWWNRCTFCVWVHTLNPIRSYRSFTPERLFAEVKHLVDNYGVREIFDDAGTLFIGPKLKKFCDLMIESGYNKKVVYGCNMRLNALRKQEDFDMLKMAGFRFILFGMESANQYTLDKLDKGMKEGDIIAGSSMAAKAGLDPHLTIMLGYPWESLEDAKRTIEVAKYCFKKGYFNTMQATIVIPYPGTPLWKECKEKGWLITEDYTRYDMREPVMKIPFAKQKLYDLMQDLYSAFFSSDYIAKKLATIRSFDDAKFFLYAGQKLLGHLLDFDPGQTTVNFVHPSFWKHAGSKLLGQLRPANLAAPLHGRSP